MILKDGKLFRNEIPEEALKKVKAARFEARIKALETPPRFQKEYEVKNDAQKKVFVLAQDYLENFKENFKQGKNLFFVGRMGTGKTHLAFYMAQRAICLGYGAIYTTIDELTAEIRATWAPGSLKQTQDVFNKYQKAEFLILDEIGVNAGTEAEIKDLYKILNYRYNNLLPTIFISNLPFSEFPNFIGPRSFDKIKENCLPPFIFTWQSFRS